MKKEKKIKKRYIVILILFVFYLIGTVGESEETENTEPPVKQETIADNNEENKETESKKIESWADLSTNPDRYKEVMIIVGERFAESTSYYYDNYTDLTSEERQLVMELYHYKQENDDLPEDFQTAFTQFSKDQGYDYFGYEFDENDPLYNAVIKSFTLGSKENLYYLFVKREIEKPTVDSRYDKDGFIRAENPYIMTFKDATYDVGNCTFTLNEIRIKNSPFKTGTYHNCYRVFLTVTNNSNTDTIFYFSSDPGPAGLYYESTGEKITIGNNSMGGGWSTDGDDPIFDNVGSAHRIPANTTKEICGQLGNVTSDKLQFTDKLRLDLYFGNEGNYFTLSINDQNETTIKGAS
jgi:hypothetical protein